ncbi:hypothetical protein P0D69_44810 [Paraburkholderia sediminicola]|uniref:hypothetical protein n=1 Tax=Paraburkholderia sediminicola TaxID=458836 RepID=UPI0038BAE212
MPVTANQPVEASAQISRFKQCIGAKLDSQEREGLVIANVINLWNSFGGPVSPLKMP